MKLSNLILIVALFVGCSAIAPTARSVCKHKALYAAIVVEDQLGYTVRVVYKRNLDMRRAHVQTQARVDGKWTWVNPGYNFVVVDGKPDKEWSTPGKWSTERHYTKSEALKIWGR